MNQINKDVKSDLDNLNKPTRQVEGINYGPTHDPAKQIINHFSHWGKWAGMFSGALVVMVSVSWGTMRLTTPRIVAFDMKSTVDLFIQQSVQQKLDQDKAKFLTIRFNAALTSSLTDWQSQHHAIILVAPAVVSTVPDITAEIRADIAQRMREGAQ